MMEMQILQLPQIYRRFLLERMLSGLIDLGWGVLDANVATAAYVLGESAEDELLFFDLREPNERDTWLRTEVGLLVNGQAGSKTYVRSPSSFTLIPGSPLTYSIPLSVVHRLNEYSSIGELCEKVVKGAGPHAIFYRLHWEVPESEIGKGRTWWRYANGGGYAPFVRAYPLLLHWADSGHLVKAYILEKYPYLDGNTGWNIQHEEYYGRPGLNYGKKTEMFSCQYMPPGHIFSFEGIGVFPSQVSDTWWLLAFLNSGFVANYLNLTCGLHKNPIYVEKVPVPSFSKADKQLLGDIARKCIEQAETGISLDETIPTFRALPALEAGETLGEWADRLRLQSEQTAKFLQQGLNEIDRTVARYIDCAELSEVPRPPLSLPSPDARALISYAVGCVLGRWQIDGKSALGHAVDDQGHSEDLWGAVAEFLRKCGKQNSSLIEAEIAEGLGTDSENGSRLWLRTSFSS